MSVADFNHRNQAERKPQPPKPTLIRGPRLDPLGYDTADFERCAAEMAARALTGVNKAEVDEELRRVRTRFGLGGRN